jgi:hypothetical protein
MANAFGCESLKNAEKKRHAVAKRKGKTYVDEAQIVFIKISVSEIRYWKICVAQMGDFSPVLGSGRSAWVRQKQESAEACECRSGHSRAGR